MNAIVYTEYGSPDVLELKKVAKPLPQENEVLVKIYAAAINPWDRDILRGQPFVNRLGALFKPKYQILGCDIAGLVETVDNNVKSFTPGDAVFGDISGFSVRDFGGFAEYVCADENDLAFKPANMTFEQAAAIPQAAVLALQGLRYKGQIRGGKKVLINGAGGGAGTFAVQIAKAHCAHVTAVDSTEKSKMLRSIGADEVIDYTKEDFFKKGQLYDLIVDVVTFRSIFDYRRILNPQGIYVMLGGGSFSRVFQSTVLGPLVSMIGDKKMGLLMHKPNKQDLNTLNEPPRRKRRGIGQGELILYHSVN